MTLRRQRNRSRWEEGHEIPVGFSKKVVGFARITNNCAICHTATYRLSEDELPHVVVAGPGHTNNAQSMLRFLFKAAHDPRFNSDIIMNEIRLVSANNYGNGGLSFIDRQIYHYLLIPLTRKALLQQEKQFTWMERYVTGGKPKPHWAPGRDDAMNLTKYFMTSMPEDNTFGPTDFPSIWNLGIRSGKDKAGKQMLLNWTGDTPAVRSVLIDSALGLGAPARPWFLQRMAELDRYLSNLAPPPWAFAETNPINQQMAADSPNAQNPPNIENQPNEHSKRRNTKRRKAILRSGAIRTGVPFLLCALIGWSRVYLGVHNPSDVLGGWLVGGIWLLACTPAKSRRDFRR